VPLFARLLARIVSTEEPDPDTVVERYDAEMREGTPLTLNETVPLNPCTADTVTVSVPFVPRAICKVVGEAESVKSPEEATINVTFTE
jgi:hypothetical protein